ncbi:MAG: hypothetical protein RJA04_1002 [Bacteroidota bacterium]|jgi:hypothetical protein
MKLLKHLPAVLLGLLFLAGGITFFLGVGADQPMPGRAPEFMKLFGGTGYLAVVKVLEIIGGALILFPAHRAKALLILGPIAVNILLFDIYIAGSIMGVGIVSVILVLIQAYLDQDKFKALL